MIGHAGGIDEIALALSPVVLFLVYTTLRGRSKREAVRRPRSGPCEYCDTMLEASDRRCPTCGFRARPLGEASAARTRDAGAGSARTAGPAAGRGGPKTDQDHQGEDAEPDR